ncbi:F-box/kelch-repeat protein SKIP25-like [Carex rostrata]
MNNQNNQTEQKVHEETEWCKRSKYCAKKLEPLLPGLPDDLARQCLLHLPPSLLFSVCHKWRRFMYSPSFPSPTLSVYSLLTDSDSSNPSLSFSSYDPLCARWDTLPPPPLPSPLLLKHPGFISRLLPVQSLSSSPYLLLLSASTPSLQPALHSPLLFHPSPPRWQEGPSFPISPRRWCATGSLNGSVYLFSGVGSSHYNASLARSAFKWDTVRSACHWKWDPLSPLRDGTFSREAVEAVESDGKLYMVNLRGHCPKEGVVYNVRMDQWEDMPTGLLSGWTGPASADEKGNIYLVDEAAGTLRVYQWWKDTWRTVVRDEEKLRGATQIAARGGRVCVVTGGGEALAVVDVKGSGRRIWIVDPPRGKKILNVHILPRMSRQC